MRIAIIEDTTPQRVVAIQELKKYAEVVAPASPEEVSEVRGHVDVIFADRLMPHSWEDARNALIERYPNVLVLEWCAVEDSLCTPESQLPRRDEKIIKTGTGRELLEVLDRIKTTAWRTKSRILEAVGSFLGLAITR